MPGPCTLCKEPIKPYEGTLKELCPDCEKKFKTLKRRAPSGQLDLIVSCIRATELVPGCEVMMKSSSGIVGYGNAQCVQEVMKELGTISLFGHNQHCKDYDVAKVIHYPFVEKLS